MLYNSVKFLWKITCNVCNYLLITFCNYLLITAFDVLRSLPQFQQRQRLAFQQQAPKVTRASKNRWHACVHTHPSHYHSSTFKTYQTAITFSPTTNNFFLPLFYLPPTSYFLPNHRGFERERVEDFSNLYWDTQMVRNNRWLSCFSRGTPAVSYLVKPGGVYKCLFWIEALHSLGVPQREGALALGSCNMKFGCHV